MTAWKEYYYDQFPSELRDYTSQHTPTHHCGHCKAPKHRRCLIERRIRREMSARFRFAWYGVTLMDQGLYTYFPDESPKWVAATGGYPLPVEPTGYGCVRVATPSRLLSSSDSFAEWEEFVDFWIEETEQHFESMSSISPEQFFTIATQDNAFDTRADEMPFEAHLLKSALAKFKVSDNG